MGFKGFTTLLRRLGRRRALCALVKAEVDILLELLELFRESAGLELHLFDLPADLPHLAFEPSDPDKETRCILLRSVLLLPGVRDIAGLADFARRTAVTLRDVNLISRRRDLRIEPGHPGVLSNRGLRASDRNQRHKQIGRDHRDNEEQGLIVRHAAISSSLRGSHPKRRFQAKFWTALSVASRNDD